MYEALLFVFTMVCVVSCTSVLVCLVDQLRCASTRNRMRMASRLSVLGSKLIFKLNPHISIKASESFDELFMSEKTPMLLINHTSPLDSFLFFAALPPGANVRVLAKSSLFSIPFFGRILKSCGHFPVHYTSNSDPDDFSVDKAAQIGVMRSVDEYVRDGGVLALFPEGRIHRGDCLALQPFRRGSLALARKHDVQLWGFVHVGVNATWPLVGARMGGYASEISYSIFKIPNAPLPADAPLDDYVQHVQRVMQSELDSLQRKTRSFSPHPP